MAGSVKVTLRTNAKSTRFAVRELTKRQLPFAMAASLTETARDARDDVRDHLGGSFKVRRRTLKNAIAYQPASKRDNPIHSKVGTRPWADFLTLHATGGVKKGERGHRIAVPTRLIRRTSSGKIRKTQKPRRVRERKGFSPHELADQGRIAVRRGGRSGEKRGIFYHVVDRVRIRQSWPFKTQVKNRARKTFPKAFDRRWKGAVRTSRNRARL